MVLFCGIDMRYSKLRVMYLLGELISGSLGGNFLCPAVLVLTFLLSSANMAILHDFCDSHFRLLRLTFSSLYFKPVRLCV